MAVYQSLTLTQVSQDIPNNTSRLRVLWQSTQTGGSYNDTRRTAKTWVTVNGKQIQADTVSYTLPYGRTAAICDREITVTHDEMGEAEVTVRTWMDTHISAGVVELSKTIRLTQIPRPTTLTAADTVIGDVCRITLSPKYPNVTHSIFYEFEALSGYLDGEGVHSDTEVRLNTNSLAFPLPDSFHWQLPNSLQGQCRLTCRTYCDGSLMGTPQTAVFKASVDEAACWPAVSGTVRDLKEETLALTGSDRVLIRGVSNAQCTLIFDTFGGATVQNRWIEDVLLEEGQDSLVINEVKQLPTFAITDSRGCRDQYTVQNVLVPYQKPTCLATLSRTHPTDGTALLQVEGQWFSGSFGAEENTLQLRYHTGNGVWQTVPLTLQADTYSAQCVLTGMAYDRVYTVTVAVSDQLSQVEKRLILKKSIPVFDWGENDFHFHVPVTVDGTLTVGGKSLADFLYPVGSVYISVAAQDPGMLFGGLWERMPERFLLGAGSRYPAGTVGGEETHTLTVTEMPAHSHTSYGWAYTYGTEGNIALRADGQSEEYKTRQTGGGKAHNNMPPYLAVYMWKRVA